MSLTIHSRDSLAFGVPLTREDTGQPLDLTGAVLTALAAVPGGAPVPGLASAPNPASGVVNVQFAAASFAVGVWTVQLVVALGSEVQTVLSERLIVKPSLPEPST